MRMLKGIMIGLSCIAFLVFLMPWVTKGIINIGNLTGMVVFFLLLIYGIFMEKINPAIVHIWQSRFGKIALILVMILGIGIGVTAITETVCMVKEVRNVPPQNTPAVVLGCSVKGTRPSRILQERLDAAYEYLTENPEAMCILSGGQGNGEDITEAQCMYEYLTEKGIDKERLILEEQSTDTEENLKYAKLLLEEHQLGEEIAIVTSEFHSYRASIIAENVGIESYSVASNTILFMLPTYYVRELYAILEQWFLR